MRTPLIQRQMVEYNENASFVLHQVIKSGVNHTYQNSSHWHEDLEIIYLFQGKANLFIDGDFLCLSPGQLAVINTESVHRVMFETDLSEDSSAITALDLLIPQKFLDEQFPEHRAVRFAVQPIAARDNIREILGHLSSYHPSPDRPHERLYMHGLLLQLLYYLYDSGVTGKTAGRVQTGNPARLKTILQYIDEHYHEPLTQADIATRFYFTPQYFSRYFKQCTGVTFSEHLTGRRIHGARQELLHTDKLITEIAFNNGFSDERSFIHAFKKMYHITPHQYRKTVIGRL